MAIEQYSEITFTDIDNKFHEYVNGYSGFLEKGSYVKFRRAAGVFLFCGYGNDENQYSFYYISGQKVKLISGEGSTPAVTVDETTNITIRNTIGWDIHYTLIGRVTKL